MKKMLFYSLPLFGNQFKGDCSSFSVLSAKFQVWAKKHYGLSPYESLSLWLAGTGQEETFLESQDDAEKIARSVIGKIPNEGVVDLTDI